MSEGKLSEGIGTKLSGAGGVRRDHDDTLSTSEEEPDKPDPPSSSDLHSSDPYSDSFVSASADQSLFSEPSVHKASVQSLALRKPDQPPKRIQHRRSRRQLNSLKQGRNYAQSDHKILPVGGDPQLKAQLIIAIEENRTLKRIQKHYEFTLKQLKAKERSEQKERSPERQNKEQVRILTEQVRVQRNKIRDQERVLRERNNALQKALETVKRQQEHIRLKELAPRKEKDLKELVRQQEELQHKTRKIENLDRLLQLQAKNHRHQLGIEVSRRKQLEAKLMELEGSLTPAAKVIKNRIFNRVSISPRISPRKIPRHLKKTQSLTVADSDRIYLRQQKEEKTRKEEERKGPDNSQAENKTISQLLSAGGVLVHGTLSETHKEADVSDDPGDSRDSLQTSVRLAESHQLPQFQDEMFERDTKPRIKSFEDQSTVSASDKIENSREGSEAETVNEPVKPAMLNDHTLPAVSEVESKSSDDDFLHTFTKFSARPELSENLPKMNNPNPNNGTTKPLSALTNDANSILELRSSSALTRMPKIDNPFSEVLSNSVSRETLSSEEKHSNQSAFLDELFGPPLAGHRGPPNKAVNGNNKELVLPKIDDNRNGRPKQEAGVFPWET